MSSPQPESDLDLDFLKRRCAALTAKIDRLQDEHRDEKARLLFGLISVDDALMRTRAWLTRMDLEVLGLPPGEVTRQLADKVDSVNELLQLKLREFDVRPLRLLDGHPDAEVADVVELWPSWEAEPGTVLEERRRGFLLGAEILRRAEVVVAVAPSLDNGRPAPGQGNAPEQTAPEHDASVWATPDRPTPDRPRARSEARARSQARSARSAARRARRHHS